MHPNLSKKMITYFSGSDWFLEDRENESCSFSFIDQICIPSTNGEDNIPFLVYHAKRMPNNWVGSDILEIIQVPYQIIKSDSFGTLEQIGEWMRFISDEEFDTDTLINKMNQIISWSHSNKSHIDEKFLIKFNLPSENHSFKQLHFHKKSRNVYNKPHNNRIKVQIPIISPLS